MLASAGLLFAIVGPSLMAADLQRAAEESKRWSPLEEPSGAKYSYLNTQFSIIAARIQGEPQRHASFIDIPCGNLKTISMMDLGPVSTFAGAIDDLTRGRL